jgi:arylsulfatase A-like enzyme
MDETIVVLWSDHGFHLGEKGITGKNTLWERSTHVPLMFAGPGIPQGSSTDQPAELLDLYPTLLELAGLPPIGQLEGLSLLPQINDPNAVRERPAITTHNPGNNSVRSKRWRYIRYANGEEELYDHDNDPHEHRNLAAHAEYADIISEHARWIRPKDAPHVEGSVHRKLEKVDGNWFWEEQLIKMEDLIR